MTRIEVGLGLPISDPSALLTWARRADEGPYRTLGLLDRLVYDNPEPMVTLAALAGATSRVRVQTEVLLAPLRSTALLAKQCATLDRICRDRFTLGIGVGGRADDYLAADVDPHHRGRRLDGQLAVLRQLWSGEPHSADVGPIGPGPTSPGGPEVLFGGFAPVVMERVARWGDGFLGAALPPEHMDGLFRRVEQCWQAAGRSGRPRLVAQVNVALGPDSVVSDAREAITAYYAFADAGYRPADAMLTTPAQVRDALAGFADIGADELMLYCWSSDPDQVNRLAELID